MGITGTHVFKINHFPATETAGKNSFDRVSISWTSNKEAFELITDGEYGPIGYAKRAMFLAKSLKFALLNSSDEDILFRFSECREYIIATSFV